MVKMCQMFCVEFRGASWRVSPRESGGAGTGIVRACVRWPCGLISWLPKYASRGAWGYLCAPEVKGERRSCAVAYFGCKEIGIGIVLALISMWFYMPESLARTMKWPLIPMTKSNHGSIGRSLFGLRRTWKPYELSPEDWGDCLGDESASRRAIKLLSTLNMVFSFSKAE